MLTAFQRNVKLAGNKRRSLSGQGGLLNRMFGGGSAPSSGGESEKDGPTTPSSSSSPHPGPANHDLNSPEVGRLSEESTGSGEKSHSVSESSPSRKSIDGANPSGEKKRRSGKASSLLASARNSLHLPGSTSSSHLSSSSADASDNSQTPLQKLGKQDPALAVPQGSHNNSAGESLPGARSTFRVGVTEDRNKKCRRTMEDTHSYLYNFLNTPAPALDLETGSKTGESTEELSPSSEQHYNHSAEPASNVVETDNGYFAIFDGHAGTFAADWCGKKLHGILEDAIRKNPNTPIPDLLDQTFTTVDRELEKLPLKNSGCTAVIAVLRWEDRIPNSHSATGSAAIAPVAAAVAKAATEAFAASNPSGHDEGSKPISEIAPSLDQSHLSSGASTADALPSNSSSVPARQTQLQQSASRQRVLYTANVGDARIVLCRNGKALRLSYDHKGSDENEGRRVSNAGGLILNNRVNGVLAVTRALGDTYMKELVTGHPYTTETVIQPDADEFIILACDGVRCPAFSVSLTCNLS